MRSLQIAAVAIGILSTARAGPGTDGPVLTVRAIADCVPAGSAVIGYASEIAQEILREAGVSTRWSSCRIDVSSGATRNGCPSGPDRPDLTIRIVSEPSPGQAVGSTALAVSVLRGSWGAGRFAYVYYGRVAGIAALYSCDPTRLLGHVMAHEIGHLLGRGHSSSGIMCKQFTSEALRAISVRYLRFSEDEGRSMQDSMGSLKRISGRR